MPMISAHSHAPRVRGPLFALAVALLLSGCGGDSSMTLQVAAPPASSPAAASSSPVAGAGTVGASAPTSGAVPAGLPKVPSPQPSPGPARPASAGEGAPST